jgi:hypothetical protein
MVYSHLTDMAPLPSPEGLSIWAAGPAGVPGRATSAGCQGRGGARGPGRPGWTDAARRSCPVPGREAAHRCRGRTGRSDRSAVAVLRARLSPSNMAALVSPSQSLLSRSSTVTKRDWPSSPASFQWWLPPPSGTYSMDAARRCQPSASAVPRRPGTRSSGGLRMPQEPKPCHKEGRCPVTVVPWVGADRTSSRPPRAASRSAMFRRPEPIGVCRAS